MNLMIVTDRYVKRENTTNFINCHLLQLHHIIYGRAYRQVVNLYIFLLHYIF